MTIPIRPPIKSKYEEYLNRKIGDIKELIDIEKEDYSIEIKEIIKSYNQGLKINIKGKNLIEPLLKKDYKTFIQNFNQLLSIPSYFDITKKTKNLFFIYTLLIENPRG